MKALLMAASLVIISATGALASYEPPVTGTPTNDGGSGARTSIEQTIASYEPPVTGTPTNDGGSGTRT